MRRIISFFQSDRTIRANIVMVGGNFVANIGAYLYYLVMGRLMTPGDYGALQSLISLTGFFIVPLATIGTVIVKYVSSYEAKMQRDKIGALYKVCSRYSFVLFFVGGVIFLVFTQFILAFLHLTNWLNVLILDIGLFLGLFIVLNKAMLQGLSMFVELTVAQFIESYGKLLLGVLAIFLGLGMSGAFSAFVFIGFVSFAYMYWLLHRRLPKPDIHYVVPFASMARYAIPSFLATLGVVSFYSTDVILVRHFFDSHNAGLYAALSVLGKIIFFGAAPVSVAMFPLVSTAHSKGEKSQKIFLTSLVITVFIAGLVSVLYTSFPHFALGVMIGDQYKDAAELLSRFSVFLSFVSIINLFALYFLSIHQMRPVYFVAIGAFIQAVLIWAFHASLAQVIAISVSVTGILTAILFYFYAKTKP